VGQNRPQFRALNSEDPAQVKDLVERLEKHQSPDADDAEYVKIELVKYVFLKYIVSPLILVVFMSTCSNSHLV